MSRDFVHANMFEDLILLFSNDIPFCASRFQAARGNNLGIVVG
jgi:hypothetical protein